MNTEKNLIESGNEDAQLVHNYVEGMDTNIPICVVHLKVDRSEVIDITERGALMNVKDIKSESYSYTEYVKQEQLQVDTEGDGLISSETITQEEVEGQLDIVKDELTNNEYLKKELLEEIDIEKTTLTDIDAVKEELSEEVVRIETVLFTSKEKLKQKELVTAAENYKSNEFKDIARSDTSSLIEMTSFECDVCERRFITKCRLNEHLRIHTGDKQYQCGICRQGFTVLHNLSIHLRTHTSCEPIKCNICQREFTVPYTLSVHLKTHDLNKQRKSYKCKICQRKFPKKYNYDTHLRTHTGDKPFKCEICLQGFTQKSNLNVHLRTHAGDKAFKCDICRKRFAEEGAFKMHLSSHTIYNASWGYM